MSNDEDCQKKLGDIKITMGNRNTVGNIGHVVNEAPEPELRQLSANVSEANGVVTTLVMIEVVAPYPPANLYLEARSPTLIECRVTPQRSGVHQTGNSSKREGFWFTNIQHPWGKYLMTVKAASRDLQFEYNFN
jgi:hypothetical protein